MRWGKKGSGIKNDISKYICENIAKSIVIYI